MPYIRNILISNQLVTLVRPGMRFTVGYSQIAIGQASPRFASFKEDLEGFSSLSSCH